MALGLADGEDQREAIRTSEKEQTRGGPAPHAPDTKYSLLFAGVGVASRRPF
jgi:hypothetical protein